jgi:hypothetical protein
MTKWTLPIVAALLTGVSLPALANDSVLKETSNPK